MIARFPRPMVRLDGLGIAHVEDKGCADTCRALVVLDLDGYEWLPSRLRIDADRINGETGKKMRALADQIEPQIRPPKPPEPQGLGAVVEDAEGNKWVRTNWPSAPWCGSDRSTLWSALPAVKVLSEGVTP